jgi:hypothetical protein
VDLECRIYLISSFSKRRGKLVTAEQVESAVKAAGISRIDHHDCSICGHMVCYTVNQGQLFFNPGCGCSWEPPQYRSWQSAADFINMQSRTGKWGDVAAKVAKGFGVELPPAEVA